MDEPVIRKKGCVDCPDEVTEHDLEVAQQAIDRLNRSYARGEVREVKRRLGLHPDRVVYDDVPNG